MFQTLTIFMSLICFNMPVIVEEMTQRLSCSIDNNCMASVRSMYDVTVFLTLIKPK